MPFFFSSSFFMHFMSPLVVKSNISSQQDSVLIATHAAFLGVGSWLVGERYLRG